MVEQYVAVVVAQEAGRRRRDPDLFLRRFDLDSADEPVTTAANDDGIPVVTASAARRMMAGRVVVVADRAAASEVAAFGAILGDIEPVVLADLADMLGLPQRSDARMGGVAGLDALIAVLRAASARLAIYDTPTLGKAAALASLAGWPSRGLFAEALERRSSEPILIRQEGTLLGSHEMAFLGNRERPEPLRRNGNIAPLDTDEVGSMLAPGGGFARVLPRFESRRPQQAMAEAVTRTLNDDGWLLVEAGTGTGKSIAYLTPAARFALANSDRVVVSTNTKALQDQLIVKDLPDLERALEAEGQTEPLRATVLKGRANYVCLRRWFAHDRTPSMAPGDAGLRAKVHLWLPATESGDRAELRLTAEEEGEFDRISAEGEACNAAKCVFQQRNQCFLYRARRNAENAHLVVVNHALLLSDSGEGGGGILPEFERLVIDEAHHLEDQATSQFGMTIPELAIPELVDECVRQDGAITAGLLVDATALLGRAAISPRDQERAASARDRLQAAQTLALRVRSVGVEFFARVRSLADAAGTEDMGYGRSLRITPAIRRLPAWSDIEIAYERLNKALMDFEDAVRWYLAAVHEARPDDTEEDDADDPFEDLEIDLSSAIDRGLEFASTLSEVVLAPSLDRVYWVSISAAVGRISLNAAPLHVGQLLRAGLLERMRSVVMTSATLTTDRGFAYVKDRLSCEEAEELTLESPFDYRSSAMLYLCDDIPEPNQPGYQQVLERALIELGTALEGRTLALFTSHAALRAAHRAIRGPLAERGINVLAQRADGSPRQLIEQFKTSSRTMLLGTSTFWEGVDVVGPALSALVIAKLPFAVPSDPVVAARSELFDDPFRQYSVPQAVLRFKQGFGRLIRSSSDRGICVVLDRRTLSKRYGTSFVQSLPTCTVRVDSASRVAGAALSWLDAGIASHERD